MTESQSTLQTTDLKSRKVPIQDRSVLVGDMVVVNGYRVDRTSLKQRFAEGGYQVQETPHFLLFTRAEVPSIILVHDFASDTGQSTIEQFITSELAPLGSFKQPSDNGNILSAIVSSFRIPEIQAQIRERSVRVGELLVINVCGTDRNILKQRLGRGGYQVQETAHFLLFTRSEEPGIILAHQFTLEEMNEDIKHYVMMELRPLGLIQQWSDYEQIFCGIIGTFFPEDARQAWHNYAANTLQRFLLFLSTAHLPSRFNFYATIGIFTAWYQRVCELCIGESFLDAGCDAGFLPLIIAERIPFMKRIVGIDIRPDMFPTMQDLAKERDLSQIHYIQADLLASDFPKVGQFDTVVAIGVIEHFTEEDMYRVLKHLLRITSHRLILTVPYEEVPEVIYEHKQLFTREKLDAVGQWCIQQLDGHGRIWTEDCDGGLLLVERLASPSFSS